MLKIFFPLLFCTIILSGCDHPSAERTQENTATDHDAIEAPTTDFKTGNFFYIARDVAEMQLRAGDYIQQLKQSQTELQQAIQEKDSTHLQETATTLQHQLKGFTQALKGLNLKSQEIEDIRQKLLESNQQVLKSPFLNGQVNWDQVNFKHIEQQMNSIQNEMLKLAAMMIPQSDSAQSETSHMSSEIDPSDNKTHS
ncbi:hypothetical protein [Acinetobacter sp. S40]|uniref:hypothetical protein n=1 Tax=Acinetobacter sp. S40 TaxID=2767434 RepID=UPI001D0E6834|nr:hypothetical protein [Acinetobacter sp. S40]